MPRISRVLFLLLAAFVTIGLIGTSFELPPRIKKRKTRRTTRRIRRRKRKKREEARVQTRPGAQEFKHVEKEKTFWVFAVAFGADGKSVAAAYRDNTVKIWDLDAKKDKLTLKGNPTETKGLVYTKGEVFVSTANGTRKESLGRRNQNLGQGR